MERGGSKLPTVRTPLTRERIVDAAIELIDRGGLEGLSMRHLGAELEVEAMSLYYHFASKAALLEAVAERLLDRLELPAATDEWRSAIRTGAHAYRELLLDHVHAIPLLATIQITNPGALRAAGRVMELLRTAGLDAPAAYGVLATVVSYVVGCVIWESGTAPLRAAKPLEVPEAADPYLREMGPLASADPDAMFELGLGLIIAGMEARFRP